MFATLNEGTADFVLSTKEFKYTVAERLPLRNETT